MEYWASMSSSLALNDGWERLMVASLDGDLSTLASEAESGKGMDIATGSQRPVTEVGVRVKVNRVKVTAAATVDLLSPSNHGSDVTGFIFKS